jgi:glutamine synthetase
MLGAGMRGIEDELELPKPVDDINLFEMSDAEKAELGIASLPKTLIDALKIFESSELMKEILGEHVHSYIVSNKKAELNSYLTSVSQWEIDRYLHRL